VQGLSWSGFHYAERKVILFMWSVIILAVVIIVAGGLTYAGFFFYGIAIKRAPKEFLAKTPDLKVDPPVAGPSWGEGADWVSRHSFRKIEITSDDGLTLRGYYLPSARAAGRTAIIAHGYSGKGKDMGCFPMPADMATAQGSTSGLAGRNAGII
jgi:hypothetical protein